MKCPLCGIDLEGKDKCSKCGRKIEDLLRGIEVEYKDFKVSEFLEIRQKDVRQHQEEMVDAVDKAQTAPEKPREEDTPPAAYSPGAKSPFPFVFVLIVFLLAISTGVFLFIRFIIR